MRAEHPAEAARALAFGRVKVCGITNAADLAMAAAAGATHAGFVMVPGTPRAVSPAAVEAILGNAGTRPRLVGMFRDESPANVDAAARRLGLHAVQLHGEEEVGAYRDSLLPETTEIWAAAQVGAGLAGPRVGADRILFDSRPGRNGAQLRLVARRRPARAVPRPARRRPQSRQCPRRVPARRLGARRRLGGGGGAALQGSNRVAAFFEALAAGGARGGGAMLMRGRFGAFGGAYVPEILMPALEQLEAAFLEAQADAAFQAELAALLLNYAGPADAAHPLPQPRRRQARIYLKREDLLHGGAHKTNQVLGQALLARRMGKTRLIAETGAGQHGVATAMAGALFGLETRIYMGADDVERQRLNVFRMRLMGAEVVPVASGGRTLKDAINEALRDWTASFADTHYLLGTVAGPHPFPTMVREFQRVIGREARAQILAEEGRLPDAVIACVGGGSNAIGMFADFIDDRRGPADRRRGGGQGASTAASMARPCSAAGRACCTAPRPMCCRTRTGRSATAGRSRRGSIIPRSAPNMPSSRRAAGRTMSARPTTRRSPPSPCSPARKGSSAPSNRPMRWRMR